MSQDDRRLDQIDASQYGQTIDRRTQWTPSTASKPIRMPGPLIQPRERVIGDWSLYFARDIEIASNLSAYNDRISAVISMGTGQSALQYAELPEIPAVGVVMHFATEVIRAEIAWENPADISAFQPRDRLITWASPGRPQSIRLRRRQQINPVALVFPLFPADILPTATRIPMFTTQITVRQMSFAPATPYIPFYCVFADVGGALIDVFACDPTAAGASTTLTTPTHAALIMYGCGTSEPALFVDTEYTVIA